jgi:hypothetical protein
MRMSYRFQRDRTVDLDSPNRWQTDPTECPSSNSHTATPELRPRLREQRAPPALTLIVELCRRAPDTQMGC